MFGESRHERARSLDQFLGGELVGLEDVAFLVVEEILPVYFFLLGRLIVILSFLVALLLFAGRLKRGGRLLGLHFGLFFIHNCLILGNLVEEGVFLQFRANAQLKLQEWKLNQLTAENLLRLKILLKFLS
jgi:hypothetical protein